MGLPAQAGVRGFYRVRGSPQRQPRFPRLREPVFDDFLQQGVAVRGVLAGRADVVARGRSSREKKPPRIILYNRGLLFPAVIAEARVHGKRIRVLLAMSWLTGLILPDMRDFVQEDAVVEGAVFLAVISRMIFFPMEENQFSVRHSGCHVIRAFIGLKNLSNDGRVHLVAKNALGEGDFALGQRLERRRVRRLTGASCDETERRR